MLNNPPNGKTAWLAGGNGFVGRELEKKLSGLGYEVNVLSRRPSPGTLVQTDYSSTDLEQIFNRGDTVINLIGILNETGFDGSGFLQAHVETTRSICDAAGKTGVRRYLHMSALNASLNGPSHYLSSKAKAELVVAESGLDYTIFRPSVIFGAEDSFTNRFAGLIRMSPGVLPLACADSRFQPVSVEDVAECFVQSLEMDQTIGKDYNLCGTEIFTLQEIVEHITQCINKNRRIVPLNPFFSRIQARILQYVPGKPFTLDNYYSLQVDSVCTNPQSLPFDLDHQKLVNSMSDYLVLR